MCACMYVCMYACMYACACMYVRKYAYMEGGRDEWMSVSVRIDSFGIVFGLYPMGFDVCMHVCLFICMYICM